MLESFVVTFSQVFVLFIFIAIGYILKKSGKLPENFSKGISNLLVYIFMPFLTFRSMAGNFKLNIIGEKVSLIITSCILLGVFLILAFIFSRIFAKERLTRDIYVYSFTFPNSGYFGNPLVLAIFGEMMLFDYMIFCIPFLFLTYTFGVYILNPERKINFKSLLNPMLVAMLIGMLVGAADIKLFSAIDTAVEMGANCMAPSAMILTGIVFASNNFKSMVTNVKAYVACFIKMIIIPLIAVFIFIYSAIPEDVAVLMVIMLTLPTGLNSIVFPEAYGGDSRTGAQFCFISTLTCLFIMPLMLSLYQNLH